MHDPPPRQGFNSLGAAGLFSIRGLSSRHCRIYLGRLRKANLDARTARVALHNLECGVLGLRRIGVELRTPGKGWAEGSSRVSLHA